MRHRKKTIILDRATGPRTALLRTLCISVIQHGRITTTPAKAKAVRSMVERMITIGKEENIHTIRQLEKKLGNKKAALRVVKQIAPAYRQRPGGYTRITKVASRQGDGAQQVVLEFIEEQSTQTMTKTV